MTKKKDTKEVPRFVCLSHTHSDLPIKDMGCSRSSRSTFIEMLITKIFLRMLPYVLLQYSGTRLRGGQKGKKKLFKAGTFSRKS